MSSEKVMSLFLLAEVKQHYSYLSILCSPVQAGIRAFIFTYVFCLIVASWHLIRESVSVSSILAWQQPQALPFTITEVQLYFDLIIPLWQMHRFHMEMCGFYLLSYDQTIHEPQPEDSGYRNILIPWIADVGTIHYTFAVFDLSFRS